MSDRLALIWAEFRKEYQLVKSYRVDLVADYVFFIAGFLLITGLFDLVAEGNYGALPRLSSLVGYLTWRAAGGCMLETASSLADDAQWGTLEQVWLSGHAPAWVLAGRGAVLVLYYTARVLVMAAILMPLLRLPLVVAPGAVPVYLLTLAGAFGVTFALAGLHLVYKNVAGLVYPLATALLFLTGALSPLDGVPVLYQVSRFLPLSIGIDLLRTLLVEGEPFLTVATSGAFLGLLANSAVYLALGLLALRWARNRVLADGSLAHY